jgi:hypothetical protein
LISAIGLAIFTISRAMLLATCSAWAKGRQHRGILLMAPERAEHSPSVADDHRQRRRRSRHHQHRRNSSFALWIRANRRELKNLVLLCAVIALMYLLWSLAAGR